MLNSDTQEYIPRIQDFTKNFLFLCVIASTLFSFLFSSYGKFINLNAIIHFVRFTRFHSFTDFFIKHRVVFTIMVRINDNVYTVVKKFNNDANMIKKNNKMEGISFKDSRGECQKLDEKYRLSTILFIRYAFWE